MNAAVAAGIKGLELVQESHDLRKKLWENALYLRDGLGHIGVSSEAVFIPKVHGTVPIASFVYGDGTKMKAIQRFLMDRGIYIQYTSYKGAGSEGVLRIVVSSAHKKAEMVRLTQTMKEAFRSISA
jgi:7-keto-8-aminopelargonate synthetase-like enzyme